MQSNGLNGLSAPLLPGSEPRAVGNSNSPEKKSGEQSSGTKPPLMKHNTQGEKQQAPQMKEVPQLQVEKIIGMSQSGCSGSSYAVDGALSSATSIAISPRNGDIAYIAGAFVVIYGMKSTRQERFLKGARSRAFQCLAFSPDGGFLAAGASCMRSPDITIWTVTENEKGKSMYRLTQSLSGHRFGIQSLRFSPSSEFLVSIGDQSDKGVFVWDTMTGLDLSVQPQSARADANWNQFNVVSSNQVTSSINAFAFHPEQRYMVTVGYSHLKLWDFGNLLKARDERRAGNMGAKEAALVLQPKSVDLSKVRQKIFVGVACHNGLVYALTSGGHLNIFNEEGKLSKWMDIQVSRAFGCTIDAAKDLLYCACADGIIRMFNARSLEHIATNQKPPPLGQTNIETGVKKIKVEKNQRSKYADVLAVVCDEARSRFIAVYSDNMVFLWDYQDQKKIQVVRTFLSHNGTIHDVQVVNEKFRVGLTDTEEGQRLQAEASLTRFVTCAADRTLRFWHFIDTQSIGSQSKSQIQKGLFRNAYCKDMSKIIFVKNAEELARHNFDVFKAKPIDRAEDGSSVQDNEEIVIRKAQDVEQAIRCLRMSHDGKFIACGDWHGNIRIHDLESPTLEETKCIEAHESEVLSIDFTRQIDAKSVLEDPADTTAGYLLASGSRDQLVQIYDSTADYGEIQIIEEHQAAVTAVRFLEERTHKPQKGSSGRPIDLQVSLISGGADQQMLKHSLSMDQEISDLDPFELQSKETFNNKIFSLDVARKASDYLQGAPAYVGDRGQTALSRLHGQSSGNPCIIIGHDRILTLRGTQRFQRIWEKRPDPRRRAVPDYLKVVTDDHGQVVVASGTDKQLSLFEAESGQLLCKAQCGELTTGMCFSQNGRHLITTSSIGVIYIWKLPDSVARLLNRHAPGANGLRSTGLLLDQIDEDENEDTLRRQSRQSQMDPPSTDDKTRTAHTAATADQPQQQKPKDVKSDLANVFAQIKQVEDQIGNAGPIAKGVPGRAVDSAPQQQEPIVAYQSKHSSASKADISAASSEPATPLNFGAQKDKLPRWAQSIAGSEYAEAHKKSAMDVSSDNMQNLFEQNLREMGNEGIRKEGTAELQLPQKIDLLEGEDEDDLQLMANEEEGSEAAERFANLRSSQFERVYGIGGTESNISTDLRRSRDWFQKKSGSKARQSIAGKFRMRKDTESQISCSAFGQGASETRVKSPNIRKEVAKEPPVAEQKPAPVKRGELPDEVTGLLESPSTNSAEAVKETNAKPKKESVKKVSEQKEIDKQFQDFDMKIKSRQSPLKAEKSAPRDQQQISGKKTEDAKLAVAAKETGTSWTIEPGKTNEKPKKEPELLGVKSTIELDDIALSLDDTQGGAGQPAAKKPSASPLTKQPVQEKVEPLSVPAKPAPQNDVTKKAEKLEIPPAKVPQAQTKSEPPKIAQESPQTSPRQKAVPFKDRIKKDKEPKVDLVEPVKEAPEKPLQEQKQLTKDPLPGKEKVQQSLVSNPSSAISNQASKEPNQQKSAGKTATIAAPPRAESSIDDSMTKDNNLSGFAFNLPTVGSQSQAIPQIAQSTSGNHAGGIQQPLLSQSPNAVGNRSMVFNPGREAASEKPAARLSGYSDQQSMLSVPLPSVSMASTQTLSPEANTMVNFQLQFEIQRINDSLRNIGQILERSQSLTGGPQNNVSMLSLPPSQLAGGSRPSLQQSQAPSFDGGLQSPSQASGSQLPLVHLDQHISGQLSQSLALWNGMMQQMQTTTSIDVGEVQRQSQSFREGDFADRGSSFGSTNNLSQLFGPPLQIPERQGQSSGQKPDQQSNKK